MTKPAGYSNTDTSEQKAVNTFINHLDIEVIKADIKTRDKYPNVDGTIEIVDIDQTPLGKLEVQVRHIKVGEEKYSCPASLVAYSDASTLPVLLICSDSERDIVFWKHISITMPEYKERQDSFTIYFSLDTDIVEKQGLYIQKWLNIIKDYQSRIKNYPGIIAEIGPYEGLEDIDQPGRIYFQKFLDTINRFHDQDFISIKRLLFPGIWKFGVGIFSIEDDRIYYQLHKIPYGDVTPLLCKFKEEPTFGSEMKSNVISESFAFKEYLSSPEEAGKGFVFDNVKSVLDGRLLPIYGEILSSDILFGFIDKYHICLGLAPNQKSYSFKDVDLAFNENIFGYCAAFIKSSDFFINNIYTVDLDELVAKSRHKTVEPLDYSDVDFRIAIYTRRFPIKLAYEALDYLKAKQIKVINRIFPQRSRNITIMDNYIWSGYSLDEEVESIKRILNSSIAEYKEFVNGNHFSLPQSPYLDSNTKFIYEYFPANINVPASAPKLYTFRIIDRNETLPKITTIISNDEVSQFDVSESFKIGFKGRKYKVVQHSRGSADLFFHDLPVLNLIYKMLSDDLNDHYNIGYINHSYI